jgi:hypothetical protein
MFNKNKKYVVWNSEKISLWDGDACDYKALLATEKMQKASFSSVVYTNDIDSVINAVNNECNVILNYKELKTPFFERIANAFTPCLKTLKRF